MQEVTPEDVTGRVTVLNGHTNEDTAYLVDDYPYGGGLRCKIRYWIDTAGPTGKYRNQQRFVRQTTNPKRDGHPWNKPHKGTYSPLAVLHLDHRQHVQYFSVPIWVTPDIEAQLRLRGITDQLTEDRRRHLDVLIRISKQHNPTVWREWDQAMTAMVAHIEETGEDPVIDGVFWERGDVRVYVGEGRGPLIYVAAARQLAAGR
jgi:hypothetical protein